MVIVESFILSAWFPAAEFINQVWFHVFSVIHTLIQINQTASYVMHEAKICNKGEFYYSL